MPSDACAESPAIYCTIAVDDADARILLAQKKGFSGPPPGLFCCARAAEPLLSECRPPVAAGGLLHFELTLVSHYRLKPSPRLKTRLPRPALSCAPLIRRRDSDSR